MRHRPGLTRRHLATGIMAGSALAALPLGVGTAHAQTKLGQISPGGPAGDPWQTLAQISTDARKLGLAVPVVTAAGVSTGADGTNFREIFPATVDFLDKLGDAAAHNGRVAQDDVKALKKRASDLLQAIHRAEKPLRQKSETETAPAGWLALLIPAALAQSAAEDRFRKYHDGYLKLFDTCAVKSEHASEVEWYIGKLTSDKYRARYEVVANSVCVPWYFIGIVHALEAGFNFDGHLHNGDPLSDQTVNVPANRPPAWQPPNDWESSARDALEFEKFTNQTDWSLAHTLFRYEAYNGFRSREQHDINTPYLWSFSNHYDSGKFIADGQWSEDAVSKQCGAGVLLRELVTRKLVQFTA